MSKHRLYYSTRCRFCQAFLEELSATPFVPEFQLVCVDPVPGRAPLPPWLKTVPSLVVAGEGTPRVGPGPVNNWLFERKLGGGGPAKSSQALMTERNEMLAPPVYNADMAPRPDATPSQDGYMIHISGKQNVSSRIVTDSYGANTYVVYAGRSARGNVSNPSGVKTGDILTRFSGNGYGTTGYAPLGSGRLDIVAVEDFTDTSRGTQLQLWNTPVGTNTLTNIATFNGVDVIFTGEVNPQKGLVLSPNVLSSITTSLSIDIANNSLYYFKTNATTTINLSGFKQGKIVEVWLTNTDTGVGSNHTITHGCYANNSTVGATSFTLSSLHSAYIKYFSIDGDLANTYCQVSYS